VSLESRAPFLDHHVVEFAWRLPLRWKFRHGEGKRLLRRLLHRYVPENLVERPKRGFAVPLDAWLRGPLRAWADDLLSQPRVREDGFFDPAAIGDLWTRQRRGSRRSPDRIWTVLMFQAWLDAERTTLLQGLRREPTARLQAATAAGEGAGD
jgi:asparagine synthase (glutamine-hydrolysing)